MFTHTLTLALSEDELQPWQQHVQVVRGKAYATDGHRMHWEKTDAADGAHTASGHRAQPDKYRPRCTSVLESLGNLDYRPVPVSQSDLDAVIRVRGNPTTLVPLVPGDDGGKMLWQAARYMLPVNRAEAKRHGLRLPHVTVQWEDHGLLQVPTNAVWVNFEYFRQAWLHVGGDTVFVAGTMDPIKVGDSALVMPVKQ